MATASRLGRQITEIIATLNELGAGFALIGGLALASHKVIRATQDVDLLADAERADAIEAAIIALGYRRLYRSTEGLIGFKLQGFVNDPRRTQDLEDIRALLCANLATLDIGELHGYFRLFDREAQLEELLNAAN